MATTPITPENAGLRIQLGLNPERGFVAFDPDPSAQRYEKILSAIPEGSFQAFRYNETGPRFSVVELILEAAKITDRAQELTGIADDIASAVSEGRGPRVHIDSKVHIIGDIPLLGQVFFVAQEEQNAGQSELAVPTLVRPLPA